MEGLSADVLRAACDYDSDALIAMAEIQGMGLVIAARRNRKKQREFAKALYGNRHRVENVFAQLK